MNLNDYTDTPKEEIFHSSGYAREASGGALGSAGSQTFEQRMIAEQGDRTIGNYRSSKVGSRFASQRATRATDASLRVSRRSAAAPEDAATGRQAFNAAGGSTVKPDTPPPRTFIEPSGRSHNPFG